MSGVWLVELHYDDGEDHELLKVFTGFTPLDDIKRFVSDNYWRKHNAYGEAEWLEGNVVRPEGYYQIEIHFVTFDDSELENVECP